MSGVNLFLCGFHDWDGFGPCPRCIGMDIPQNRVRYAEEDFESWQRGLVREDEPF